MKEFNTLTTVTATPRRCQAFCQVSSSADPLTTAVFMIQLFHVSKIYPPNSAALTDINLQIAKKEFVFLTGPSGAGKSTLLRLLFREEEPTEGQILINGKNITRLNGRGVARLRQEVG